MTISMLQAGMRTEVEDYVSTVVSQGCDHNVSENGYCFVCDHMENELENDFLIDA